MLKNNLYDREAWQKVIVSGAQTDQTISDGITNLYMVRVWAVGAASSKIELYDGSVATGEKFDDIAGTANGYYYFRGRIENGLHAKVTDSSDTLRATFWIL